MRLRRLISFQAGPFAVPNNPARGRRRYMTAGGVDLDAVLAIARSCIQSRHGFAVGKSRYLRSAFVAKPGIMNTMEMAKPTIRTVLSGKLLAMVLMAMLTTVDPT